MWRVRNSLTHSPDESKRDEHRAENAREESPLAEAVSPDVAEGGVLHGLTHPRAKSDCANLEEPHNELRGQKAEQNKSAESAESDRRCEDVHNI